MNILKNLKPIMFFESKIPDMVRRLTGINAIACSFGIFVFFAGKKELVDESIIRHETIHFRQQLELLFVFQWILYGIFHLIGYVKNREVRWAYLSNPFELEAYDNDEKIDYLNDREHFAWAKYVSNRAFSETRSSDMTAKDRNSEFRYSNSKED